MSKPGETAPHVEALPFESPAPTEPGEPGGASILSRGTRVGRYVIDQLLGEGGMGVVYVAHDPELDRRVALKVLRPELTEAWGATAFRDRLVREAQAMARLNHPNVVTIYDTGLHDGQVFLAVELVEGVDLWSWLSTPRTWREVLDVFLKAGRGLAAAHAAGLVHRDFKPENVLLGKRGEVKVTDFGLARAAEGDHAHLPETPQRTRPGGLLRAQLTRAGFASGTPGYMAPEQILLGQTIDARADEFSFCVALYDALYGQPPFAKDLDPRGSNPIADSPAGTLVPPWVRKILLRGLSIKREDRYSSISELLDALTDDPAVRRARLFTVLGIGATVLAAIAATTVLVVRQRTLADPCHAPDRELSDIWDHAARSQVRAAFVATRAPDAINTATRAEKAMDRASDAWLAAYRDACHATRVLHTQPEAALDLRLDCLDEQRLDLGAAVEVMSRPDPKDPTSALAVANKLPLPLECADARALSVIEQPPPERRPQVEALRLEVAQGLALNAASRFDAALEALRPIPEQAHAFGAHALEAKSLEALADTYNKRGADGDYAQAIALLNRAESAAGEAHLDQLATRVAARLAGDLAATGGSSRDVDAALRRAQDGLQRIGTGGLAEYHVEEALGEVESLRGHDLEAARHGRRALELAERIYGEGREEPLGAANNLAASLEPLGDYDEMIALCRKIIAGFDAFLGPANLRVLPIRVNLAETLFDLGRLHESQAALDELFVRMPSGVEGDHLAFATGLAVQAALQARRGEKDESLRTAVRAANMGARLQLLDSPNGLDLHRYTGEAYLRDDQPTLALDTYERHLAHQDIAADSASWVPYLRLGGWAYLDAGQPGKALPILERALALSASHPFYPGWVARLRYQIARALIAARGDRNRAEALAQQAHEELVNVEVCKDLLVEIDAWRAKTFPPR